MDEEGRFPFKSRFHQLSVNLLSVPIVSDNGELEWRLDRLDLLDALVDVSDRSGIRGEGEENQCP